MKRLIFAIASAAAVLIGATIASAAPMSPAPAQQSDVAGTMAELAHGCHRDVELGPGGWHYHVGPSCRRVAVAPRREERYEERRYVPRYEERRRGPICRDECRYIGPIKTCKRVCR